MNSARILAAASAALFMVATGAPQTFAATGVRDVAVQSGGFERVGHGDPAGRSDLRDASRSRFMGSSGGWGFAHRGRRWTRHVLRSEAYAPGRLSGDLAAGFYGEAFMPPYGPAGFGAGPGPFGPSPQYREGFPRRPGYFPLPPATALAPLAYGAGPHDGAYAYGYNGYAQTPPLPVSFTRSAWIGRGCGC